MVVSMAYPDFMSIKMLAKIKVHIAVRDNVCNVTLKLRFNQRDPDNLKFKAGIIIFSFLANFSFFITILVSKMLQIQSDMF